MLRPNFPALYYPELPVLAQTNSAVVMSDECTKQRPDFVGVWETNQTGKKVRLFKYNELKRDRSSLSLELTNPNEQRVRFSKDNRTRP